MAKTCLDPHIRDDVLGSWENYGLGLASVWSWSCTINLVMVFRAWLVLLGNHVLVKLQVGKNNKLYIPK